MQQSNCMHLTDLTKVDKFLKHIGQAGRTVLGFRSLCAGARRGQGRSNSLRPAAELAQPPCLVRVHPPEPNHSGSESNTTAAPQHLSLSQGTQGRAFAPYSTFMTAPAQP
jgi:hypothetical protein